MRKFVRWRLVTVMILVAVVALVFGGYRTAVVRRQHDRVMAAFYGSFLVDERLQLLDASFPAQSSEEEARNRSKFNRLKTSIDVHAGIKDAYQEAADSTTGWLRIRPVAQPCSCAFCTEMNDRNSPPRSAPLGRYQTS